MLLEDITELTAAENFRCDALSCRMSGTACAKMHALARTTMDVSRHACIRCLLGAKRATLLKIGRPACQAEDGGLACVKSAEPGSKYCAQHAHRSVAPKVRLAVVEAKFLDSEVDWTEELPPPPTPVPEEVEPPRPQRAVREKPLKGAKRARPQPAEPEAPPVVDAEAPPAPRVQARLVVCACGVQFHPRSDRRFPTLDVCSWCVGRSIRRCRRLGLDLTAENISTNLEVARVVSEKANCKRCGRETLACYNICYVCVASVISVFARRYARSVSRDEAQTAYLELPPKRQYSSRKGAARLD